MAVQTEGVPCKIDVNTTKAHDICIILVLSLHFLVISFSLLIHKHGLPS